MVTQPDPVETTLTRVWIFLPLADRTRGLVETVITTVGRRFGGCTFNKTAHPSAFAGRWKARGGKIKLDPNVIIIISDVTRQDQENLLGYLRRVKGKIEALEKVSWITCHQVELLA